MFYRRFFFRFRDECGGVSRVVRRQALGGRQSAEGKQINESTGWG